WERSRAGLLATKPAIQRPGYRSASPGPCASAHDRRRRLRTGGGHSWPPSRARNLSQNAQPTWHPFDGSVLFATKAGITSPEEDGAEAGARLMGGGGAARTRAD